jgi:HEAT repeat protein
MPARAAFHTVKETRDVAKVIQLIPAKRLAALAARYAEDPALFLSERAKARSTLLRALPLLETGLRHQALMLLGAYCREDAAPVCLKILEDALEPFHTRHFAAFQLAVTLPWLECPAPLLARLAVLAREALFSETRALAATALGFPGNAAAIPLLAELLRSPAPEVREAAAAALCRTESPKAAPCLLDVLEQGGRREQRVVLYNLWRSGCGAETREKVYLRFLQNPDPELRLVALVLLGSQGDISSHVDLLRTLLDDGNPKIRQIALTRLVSLGADALLPVRVRVRELLSDPGMEIKRAALLAHKMIAAHEEHGC